MLPPIRPEQRLLTIGFHAGWPLLHDSPAQSTLIYDCNGSVSLVRYVALVHCQSVHRKDQRLPTRLREKKTKRVRAPSAVDERTRLRFFSPHRLFPMHVCANVTSSHRHPTKRTRSGARHASCRARSPQSPVDLCSTGLAGWQRSGRVSRGFLKRRSGSLFVPLPQTEKTNSERRKVSLFAVAVLLLALAPRRCSKFFLHQSTVPCFREPRLLFACRIENKEKKEVRRKLYESLEKAGRFGGCYSYTSYDAITAAVNEATPPQSDPRGERLLCLLLLRREQCLLFAGCVERKKEKEVYVFPTFGLPSSQRQKARFFGGCVLDCLLASCLAGGTSCFGYVWS